MRDEVVNVLAILKDETGELYCFLFDDTKASSMQLLSTLCRFAADPELSFTCDDALILRKAQRMLRSEVQA